MVISYLAPIPDPTTFRIYAGTTVRRPDPDGTIGKQYQSGQEGYHLMGRFTGQHRDVCAEYYRSRSKRPPYLALAECADGVDAIQQFTAKWGTLTQKGTIPPGWKPLVGAPGCPWLGDDNDFLMDITGWIHLKQRFLLWLEAAQKKGTKGRAELLALFASEGWFSFDAGDIALGLTWRTAAWLPQLRTRSLYMAFIAMLWLDVSARDRMILCCANPNCGKYFSTEKNNKKYCEPECALQVARRRWWRAHGTEWRRNN